MSIKKENITKLIDKSILDKIVEASLMEVIGALQERIDKFSIIVCRDNPNITLSDYDYVDIDLIDGSRLRYNICQLRHCNKRIDDIKWIIKIRDKFEKLDNRQMFNLILLKEKLQKTDE